jgi:hypothetical protein
MHSDPTHRLLEQIRLELKRIRLELERIANAQEEKTS